MGAFEHFWCTWHPETFQDGENALLYYVQTPWSRSFHQVNLYIWIWGGADHRVSKGLEIDLYTHNLRSRIGAGMFLSNLDPVKPNMSVNTHIHKQLGVDRPPGAVGAWYGSGCFHFSSRSSASWNNAWKFPSVTSTQTDPRKAYPLLSRISNVFVCLEQRSNIQCLAPP